MIDKKEVEWIKRNLERFGKCDSQRKSIERKT